MYNTELKTTELRDRIANIFAAKRSEVRKVEMSRRVALITEKEKSRALNTIDICAQLEFEVAVMAHVSE